jgi:hypothetical protein
VDSPLAADGIDGDDIRVLQSGGGQGLVLEAGELPLVEHPGKGKRLERDAPLQRNLLGFIDDSHTAAADLADDAKIAQRRPAW